MGAERFDEEWKGKGGGARGPAPHKTLLRDVKKCVLQPGYLQFIFKNFTFRLFDEQIFGIETAEQIEKKRSVCLELIHPFRRARVSLEHESGNLCNLTKGAPGEIAEVEGGANVALQNTRAQKFFENNSEKGYPAGPEITNP